MSDFLQLHMEREFSNPMTICWRRWVFSISIISVSTGTESQHRSFVNRYGSPSGLQGERSWLELCPRRLRSQRAECYKLQSFRHDQNICKRVFCVLWSMPSALRHAYSSSVLTLFYLLFPSAVHSHMFFSWQVNGSDGMYKYEEIILERVSFKSLQLGSFHP